MNTQRLDWIDIAKGMGIILVVLGHTLVPQVRETGFAGFLWICIYNFHMPLFFFLSGYLFEKGLLRYTEKGKFILGKLQYLILPYLIFSVFAYLFIAFSLKIPMLSKILESGGYSAVALKDAILQIITYNDHIDKHLWFVFSLFLVFLVNILIPKFMKSKPMLIVLLGLYISKAYVHYYGILDYITSDLLFFSLARTAFNTQQKKSTNPIIIAVIFIITNCLYSYFYVTQMPSGIAKGVLYFIRSISSVTGIMTVCSISKYLQNKAPQKLLKMLGIYSYDIYLMHAPFLVSGLMGILLAYSPFPTVLCCASVLILGLFIPIVASKFIIRKIPFLSVLVLGKNYKKASPLKANKTLSHNS